MPSTQQNYLNLASTAEIHWTRTQDRENNRAHEYRGSLSDVKFSISRTSTPFSIDTTLSVTREGRTLAQLTGGFADILCDSIERRFTSDGNARKALQTDTHFPLTHEHSSGVEKLWTALKHGTVLKDALILEQIYEAVRHAPLHQRNPASWKFSQMPAQGDMPVLDCAQIDFNGWQISVFTTPTRAPGPFIPHSIEDQQTAELAASVLFSSVEVRSESGEIVFQGEGLRPAKMMSLLRQREADVPTEQTRMALPPVETIATDIHSLLDHLYNATSQQPDTSPKEIIDAFFERVLIIAVLDPSVFCPGSAENDHLAGNRIARQTWKGYSQENLHEIQTALHEGFKLVEEHGRFHNYGNAPFTWDGFREVLAVHNIDVSPFGALKGMFYSTKAKGAATKAEGFQTIIL